jgi:uncharacterized protein
MSETRRLTDGQRFVAPSMAQLLADLRWLLLSPPLLNEDLFPGQIQSFTREAQADIERWLDQLPHLKPELSASDFEMENYQRLGKYAEKLLKFFLLNYPSHAAKDQLLAHNLAINSNIAGGSTQGEIDFLVIDDQEQPWHWEMAVKFFACEPLSHRTSPLTAISSEIIGPNRRDRLSLKITKLFDRQLRHSAPVPFQNYPWRAQAFVKGRIYYRLGEVPPCHFIHEGRALLHPNHQRGFWCLSNELHQIEEHFPASCVYPLFRSEWLSPKCSATLDPERTNLNLEALPEGLQLPLMIAIIKDKSEVGRGFILPEDHLSQPVSV